VTHLLVALSLLSPLVTVAALKTLVADEQVRPACLR
jgi:hypothetical protein